MPEEVDPGAFTASDILALTRSAERSSAKRTFEFAGRQWTVEVYTDATQDAERWTSLVGALMWGQAQQTIARATKTEFVEKVGLPPPHGGIIEIKDPSYIGNVKLLSQVIKSPALSYTELLIWGHNAGRGFMEVCDWAAEVNGVSEYAAEQMRKVFGPNGSAPEVSEKPTSGA